MKGYYQFLSLIFISFLLRVAHAGVSVYPLDSKMPGSKDKVRVQIVGEYAKDVFALLRIKVRGDYELAHLNVGINTYR